MNDKVREERVLQLQRYYEVQEERAKMGLSQEPHPEPTHAFKSLYEREEYDVFDFLTKLCEHEAGRKFAGRLLDVF